MKETELTPAELLNAVLEWFAKASHGRLWCVCGYLIWTCSCTKGQCPGLIRMIITDHATCIKPAPKKR